MIRFLLRAGLIPAVAMIATSYASAAPMLNRRAIEAQIARCGLKFVHPVWKARKGRHAVLVLTVPALGSESHETQQCVIKISVANDIETEMNAAGVPGK